jgi:hypothetical protein
MLAEGMAVKMSESPAYINGQEHPRHGKPDDAHATPGRKMAHAGPIQCREQFGGLLKHPYGEAA